MGQELNPAKLIIEQAMQRQKRVQRIYVLLFVGLLMTCAFAMLLVVGFPGWTAFSGSAATKSLVAGLVLVVHYLFVVGLMQKFWLHRDIHRLFSLIAALVPLALVMYLFDFDAQYSLLGAVVYCGSSMTIMSVLAVILWAVFLVGDLPAQVLKNSWYFRLFGLQTGLFATLVIHFSCEKRDLVHATVHVLYAWGLAYLTYRFATAFYRAWLKTSFKG